MLKSDDSNQIKNLSCPVTLKIFKFPVVLIPSGKTVEMETAEELLKAIEPRCPVTQTLISGYMPNDDLRRIVDGLIQANPDLADKQYIPKNPELRYEAREAKKSEAAPQTANVSAGAPAPRPAPQPLVAQALANHGFHSANMSNPIKKILFLGDLEAKKSALISDISQCKTTIGMEFQFKSIDSLKTKFQLWDTPGQERFRTISGAYSRGTHGIVLVYDPTKDLEQNKQFLLNLLNSVTSYLTSPYSILIVGYNHNEEAQLNQNENLNTLTECVQEQLGVKIIDSILVNRGQTDLENAFMPFFEAISNQPDKPISQNVVKLEEEVPAPGKPGCII